MANVFDPSFVVLVVLVLAMVVIGVFVWRLHQQGVPNNQLSSQTALKALGVADMVEERMVEALRKWADSHPATLRESYFDAQDFYSDLGRLGTSYSRAVTLDSAIKRNGDQPAAAYQSQQNGNVVLTK